MHSGSLRRVVGVVVIVALTLMGLVVGTAAAAVGPSLSVSDVTVIEDGTDASGNPVTSVATFTISLSEASPSPVTVDYFTEPGTATAGSSNDYLHTSGGVSFPANSTTPQTVKVTIVRDATDEPDEQFTLGLTNAVNASIGDGIGEGTITDNDQSVVEVAPATAEEDGLLGAGTAEFELTMAVKNSQPVVVTYSTASNTGEPDVDKRAVAGTDYTAASSKTITIPAGSTSATIEVPLSADTTYEYDETFTLLLQSATARATISSTNGTATGTITDNDDRPAVSVEDTTVTEGDTGTTNATVTFKLAAPSGVPISIGWNTSVTGSGDDATASSSDYVGASGTVSFTAGDVSETRTVAITGDTLAEQSEFFYVFVNNVDPGDPGSSDDRYGVVTITDNDPAPTISISNFTADEGDPALGAVTTTFNFTVTVDQAHTTEIEVDYATANGTATGSALPLSGDYTSESGTITFPSCATSPSTCQSQTVSVTVNRDDTAEPTETFFVNLANPQNAKIAETSPGVLDKGTGTITNDDGVAPAISVDNVSVVEGNGGTKVARFTVSIAPNVHQDPVSVGYMTQSDTASASDDYESTSGILVFQPGDASETIDVTVNGDTIDEGASEAFKVVLSNAFNASIGDGEGIGTITDDDNAPTVTINDVSPPEGNLLSTPFRFTVSLSNPSSSPVSVAWATADGTATAGSDYAADSGTVTFAAGSTSETVDVSVTGDTLFESNETFFVNLTSPTNATIGDAQGLGTITNDDSAPSFTVSDAGADEGNTLTFTITLNRASGASATVKYRTVDGTATVADGDYDAVALTPVTFAAGETTKQVTVDSNADTKDEPDETFIVRLSEPFGATISDADGEGEIRDDDGTPTVSVDDASVTEGDAGTKSIDFTIHVLPANSTGTTVTYALGATGDTATKGVDYDEPAEQDRVVVIPPGETDATVSIDVLNDTTIEGDEFFTFRITGVAPPTVQQGDVTATGRIVENDAPSASVNDVTISEGHSGTSNATFTVTLSGPSSNTVAVTYSTGNGTATAPSDYESRSGTATFEPGVMSQTVSVPVVGDVTDETNETFVLNLTGATNAAVADGQGSATITDDDSAPTFSINDVSVTEGNSGTVSATFTVTKSGATQQTSTVSFTTANGSATSPADFSATNGSLSFTAGDTTKTISVAVKGDTIDEANETFTVTLSGATNATIADGSGTGTINDDDATQRYVLAGADGRVYAFNTVHRGDMAGVKLNQPIIGLTMTPSGNGYWLVAKDGGIFPFGDAEWLGSMGDQKLNQPVLGVEATPTGKGYWLFAADGGIFSFGDAKFHGSTGDMKLNAPVIGMETTGDGRGYWLVAQDGGIFTFNAPYHGSTGDMKLNQPVFDMAARNDASGYWLVARDGGIFNFNVPFKGSAAGQTTSSVIGMRDTPSGDGYWIADATGRVLVFGDAQYLGDNRTTAMTGPIVGFAAVES